MPRISDAQLKQLKNDVSLLRLIESQGHEVIKQGKDHVMCCPFHEDKTPSLKISAAKNLFNCFGCGASGTVIDWVMKTQGLSFRHACEVLLNDAGISLDANTKKYSTKPKLNNPLSVGADNEAVLNQVVNYYHQMLKQTPEALAYLKSRGLNNTALIETFKLGFANRTLGFRLPAKNRKEGKAIRSQLQEIGILRQSGHEHFNGSIVVPVIDQSGKVCEIYGRKIRNNLRKGTPKHLYLPGAHAGVFNAESLKLDKEVILCESLIDAMTFWVNGYRNVTCAYGTGGFTDELLQTFKDNKIKRVLIAYDRDKAGNEAADKLSEKLNKEHIDTYRILFPQGMDANEYALSAQPSSESLGAVIRKAQWMGSGQEPARPTTKTAESGDSAPQAVKEESYYSLAAKPAIPEAAAYAVPAQASDLDEMDVETSQHEVNIIIGSRSYRIRGMAKNMSYEQLKINLLISIKGLYYIDTIDLYHAKARASYIKQAAIELGYEPNIIKKDLGQILMRLELLQEQQINGVLNKDNKSQTPTLSEAQYSQAMALLKSPDLLNKITSDLTASGIIGEDTNKLTAYLGCVSRKLDKPLAIIIQSTSAAGKSTLMDAVIEMMPEADKVQYSAMTGQSLFYMGETSLKNKILAISEEEGAHNASYALKLLQSEGKITIASTGKDESSGTMETKEYSVEGPIMLFMTTTAIDIDEELMNRCLILTVNESREQTQAIHAIQRDTLTLEGLKANSNKQQIISTHQNAQSLLQPLKVVNPYAHKLTFMSNKTRTRRDHMKYLNLINTIALLHQHQRTIKSIQSNGETIQYIEVAISDIDWANKLAHKILGRTLDELPPQTRTLLNHIKTMVKTACKKEKIVQTDYRFSRRDIREFTSWSDSQLKTHCGRLAELEYLIIHKGGRGQSLVYELVFDGQNDVNNSHMMGLIDVKQLCDDQKSGLKSASSGPSLDQVCPKSGGGLGAKNSRKASNNGTSKKSITNSADKALLAAKKINSASHRTGVA